MPYLVYHVKAPQEEQLLGIGFTTPLWPITFESIALILSFRALLSGFQYLTIEPKICQPNGRISLQCLCTVSCVSCYYIPVLMLIGCLGPVRLRPD